MKTWRKFVSRYAVVIFFLLAYGISWSSAIPTGGSLLPHGPMLAAVIVLAAASGRRGLSDLWQQLVHWRVPWHWYLIAPGIHLALHMGAFGLNLLLGAALTGPGGPQGSAVWLLLVQLLLLGGQWEEPGWTGYALPRFQQRFAGNPGGLLIANLALGALRAGWHLPLLIYGHIPWYDLLFFSFAMQFLITWLYNRTGRSLPVVMLFHLASNFVFALFSPYFSGADLAQYQWLFIALAWLVVLVVYRRPFRQPESEAGALVKS